MDSLNKVSEGDDPKDFNGDEVIEYLATATDEEKQRVHDAENSDDDKQRKGVLEASLVEDDEEDEDELEDEEDEPEEEDDGEDEYDPHADPDVPSSSLADTIVTELKSGNSPTLQAVKDAAKNK